MAHIDAEMLISDVLQSCPGAAAVFERYGLGCAGCLAASMESLHAVAAVHDVDVLALLDDLNSLHTQGPCGPRKES